MNIVQSFWSKPSFHEEQSHNRSRNMGGWLQAKYLWFSTAFSCYSAKAHSSKMCLVTDSEGYEILINRLHLPYDDVTTTLDTLSNEDHRLWVLGKLAAFKMQRQPFLHIDNDIYLWAPVPFSKKPGFLIAQSRIKIPESYKNTLKDIFDHFAYIPDVIHKRGIPENVFVINTGIIGGNDLEFFQEYSLLAEQFLEKNKAVLAKVDTGLFMTILSEYLLTCLAEETAKPISFLINVPVEDAFKAIVRFNLVPLIDQYVHLVGQAKKNLYACEQLEYRFRYEFPQEYKRINSIVRQMCPAEFTIKDNSEQERWQHAQKAFSVLYTIDMEGLLQKKVKLPENFQVQGKANEQGELEYSIEICKKNTGISNSWKLEEMDEALVHFISPVCINELLEGLKVEGFIQDEESLAQYRFKLIDFVTEKITIDGVLEFA